uniref:uncharacterized protein n=1 Tax=Semicossyphus pulcher TaxID=241346 RepID=UPI0037E89207
MSIYVIITALATTALARGSIECDFSEVTGDQQCFGAVGQMLIFQLPNTANTHLRLKKDKKYIILDTKKNKVTLHKEYVNQSELFANGTFKLGKAMKRHSGEYVLEEFGSDGALQKKVDLHLKIRALVSKPAVSQLCFSPEQMIISCSSEGDAVEFNLTLDGVLLMQTKAYNHSQKGWTANMQSKGGTETEDDKPGVSNVAVSLHGNRTGELMCDVWNNFSREETVIHLDSCKSGVF